MIFILRIQYITSYSIILRQPNSQLFTFQSTIVDDQNDNNHIFFLCEPTIQMNLIKDLHIITSAIPMPKSKKDRKKQIEQKREQKKEQRRKEREMFKRAKKKMGKGDTFKLTREYIQYYEEFDHEIEFMRIKLRDVAGDGNCLFRSIADQLDGSQATHAFLREQACKYILNNQQFFRNFIDEDQQGTIYEYVQNMRKNGQWGGHLQLQALSQCLQCTIVVHKRNHEQYYVTPILSQPSGTVFHLGYFQHQDFQHYLSIRDINDNSNDPAVAKLKALNNNMYQHLANIGDPQQLALMKQIQELEIGGGEGGWGQYDQEKEEEQFQKQVQIQQPYPGLPPNKKCRCGSNQIYKNCCLKNYHKKIAQKGY